VISGVILVVLPGTEVVGKAAPGSFKCSVGSSKRSASSTGAARQSTRAQNNASSIGEL
jgi:hypothetical protein